MLIRVLLAVQSPGLRKRLRLFLHDPHVMVTLIRKQKNFLPEIQKHSFDSLLDLGCGAGRLIIKFAKYFHHITALDPDLRRINNAKKNIAANNIQNVSYIQSPFCADILEADNFDVVICNQIIQHIDTRTIEPMIQGIFKILKSNGIFVLTTRQREAVLVSGTCRTILLILQPVMQR